ncbi:MAG: hypothetical protein U5R46_16015 [Gammaproteobacteria bacterium]|nr:hypothetical protein [Gammaproteobacteria bacterium]
MQDRNKRVPRSGTTRAVDAVGASSPADEDLTSARRRLLRTLGRGAGATAALLPVVWSRPLVDTVVLPAHAETSPAGCTVRIVWFNDSNDDEICLTVESLNGGADPLPPPGDCVVNDGDLEDPGAQGTFEEVLPPGSYAIVMTANFDGDNVVEDYEGTITCCTGETFAFSGVLEGEAGGTESETVAIVTVTEDGECSVEELVSKEGP